MLKNLLNMTILIVDDDLITLKLLKGLLEKQGYNKIKVSNTGKQAIEVIKEEPPDLVLLDVFMPEIDGYEVCRGLKSDSSTSHIPVIMVTGGAADADETIEKSFKSGATDYITKPIRANEFLARVKSSLIIKSNHDLLLNELKKSEEAEKEKNKLVNKLEQALSEIKTLKGILPICSNCKNIRDDKGYWKKLETYIQDHSGAEFSHGICPDCIEKIYNKEEWYDKNKKKT